MKPALTLLIVFFMHSTQAQNISDHRWQQRVLLVIAEDTVHADFLKQLTELKTYEAELNERKLIIYQITTNAFQQGLGNNDWEKGKLYQKYKDVSAPFQVILIGLDGGEKLKQNVFIPANKLFSLIDGMPMRKAEIRKKS